jgi:RNA polymerase sigma-70 factor (ECF subfamily)
VEFVAFDAGYLERLRAGDLPTEKHFVGYFSELIHLKLRSRLASPDAVEDVRQETFTRVLLLLRKPGGLREAATLGAFVNSVCNHVLQEQYRSQKKRGSSLDDEPEQLFVDHKPSPLSLLESKDRARLVQQSLAALPSRDRDLLRAVLMEERDKDAICAEYDISREYLRVLVHRAKQSFRLAYDTPSRQEVNGP